MLSRRELAQALQQKYLQLVRGACARKTCRSCSTLSSRGHACPVSSTDVARHIGSARSSRRSHQPCPSGDSNRTAHEAPSRATTPAMAPRCPLRGQHRKQQHSNPVSPGGPAALELFAFPELRMPIPAPWLTQPFPNTHPGTVHTRAGVSSLKILPMPMELK